MKSYDDASSRVRQMEKALEKVMFRLSDEGLTLETLDFAFYIGVGFGQRTMEETFTENFGFSICEEIERSVKVLDDVLYTVGHYA